MVTPTLPLPFGEADGRWQHVLLSGLPGQGADVTCLAVTPASPADVEQAQLAAREQGWRLVHLPRAVPSSMRRRLGTLRRPLTHLRYSAGALEAVQRLDPASYDVVHVEHLFTGALIPSLERAVTHLHFLDVADWEQRTRLTPRERFAYLQMRRATAPALRRARRLLAASDRVADDAVRLGASQRPLVVPLALDTSLYPTVQIPDAPVVGVIGSMHWGPSRTAAQRVLTSLWPRIHRAVPDARLVVAGRASEEFLASYFPLDGAELIGEVAHPEDFFGQVSLLLYPPPRGSGPKMKVLEALAYGVPVLSNREGLEGVDCDDCVLRAETDDEFVDVAVALLRDPGRRAALPDRGREWLESAYAPDVGVRRLVDAYRSLGLIE